MVRDAVLHALEAARGERISGGALARQLGVSRAAVWKAIDGLRAEGLVISSVPGSGYRLEAADDSLTAAGVQALLHTRVLGRVIDVRPVVTSTNTVLKEQAAGLPHGFALLAGQQTAGRGRLGRTFVSPAGDGLYLSVLLRPDLPLDRVSLLTLLAAVAVCRTLETVCGLHPGIKWVNDVYLNGRKVCGILTEAAIVGESGAVDYAIAGIGINLRFDPAAHPDLAGTACGLADFCTPPRRAVLAAALLDALETAYDELVQQGPGPLLDAYRARMLWIGRTVTVHSPAGSWEGVCESLDDTGALCVRDAGGTLHPLHAGEISIRPSSN